MVGLKNFVVWGAIVTNRYLNSMGGSLIETSVLTTSLMVQGFLHPHSWMISRFAIPILFTGPYGYCF